MNTVYQLSDNIISSLGFSTEENIHAVFKGISGIKYFPNGEYNVPEAFYASQVNKDKLNEEFAKISQNENITRFEKLAILSVFFCHQKTGIDLSSKRTLFMLSTTKGNVKLLGNEENFRAKETLLSYSAHVIAKFFNNENTPIVISNACISGVSAQIVAKRLLHANLYDYIVVVGAEELSKFIISGFQSFKALAPEICKPFDANRLGLNLGEGAATIIYAKTDEENKLAKNTIVLEDGTISNDANHISGPSRTGEGLFLALQSLTEKNITIDFINAHGTATPYNDEMEAIAINRAGMENCPTHSLKGYFGHTLGAAGLLETVIASNCLKQNTLVKSLGYESCGVTQALNIIQQTVQQPLTTCIKTVSGFGGCNAAIVLKKIRKV